MILCSTDRQEEKETTELVFGLDDVLTAKVKLTHYFDFGATEWTVFFKNSGQINSGILENMETRIPFAGECPVLRGILGDHVNFYRPYAVELDRMPAEFVSRSGRPTHINFPYFNLECGDGGYLLAIGWAGSWRAKFEYNGIQTLYTACSVNGLHTYLKPGECIRTALFVNLPYFHRHEYCATNIWRRWFLKYNLPRADATGKAIEPFSTCTLANDTGLPNSDGSISERYYTWKPSMDKMIAEDVKVDFRWFDAGWYIAPDGTSPEEDWWNTIGTWELDKHKWPGKTFLESTDYARAHGMKTLMWFEPERVTHVDDLIANYGYKREWMISTPVSGENNSAPASIVNNIGDPQCLAWTTARICKTLEENKVEMYREDNNFNPGEIWGVMDAREGDDRTGITECKAIAAHYKLWDDIIACTLSYGGCGFVDSCASGGGRNDLESMRRGIPLLRSDYDRTTTALRLSMTTSFNKWIPFCGANTREKAGQLDAEGRSDLYIWRASYLPVLNVDSQFVQQPEQDFEIMRIGIKEWKKVSPYLLKDFYTLTPWHGGEDTTGMTAYSFYDEDAGKGVLLAFRQESCGMDSLTVYLPYAKDQKEYILIDEDSAEKETYTGRKLRSEGVSLCFPAPRTARLFWVFLKKGE